jgi:hypothetical protein
MPWEAVMKVAQIAAKRKRTPTLYGGTERDVSYLTDELIRQEFT